MQSEEVSLVSLVIWVDNTGNLFGDTGIIYIISSANRFSFNVYYM